MIICYSISGHPDCSKEINGFFSSPNDVRKHPPPSFCCGIKIFEYFHGTANLSFSFS